MQIALIAEQVTSVVGNTGRYQVAAVAMHNYV